MKAEFLPMKNIIKVVFATIKIRVLFFVVTMSKLLLRNVLLKKELNKINVKKRTK